MCITLATVKPRGAWGDIIHSILFKDFAAYFCPVRKRAWLYKTNEPDQRIVAEKQMDVAPTEDQVSQWVVDWLNKRINEELNKIRDEAA